jgi:hypothetical protein
VGTWVEGLAALSRLARVDPRIASRRSAIDEATACGASLLARRQQHDPHDGRIDGAWYANGKTRVDDQQHPVSALVAVVALRTRPR